MLAMACAALGAFGAGGAAPPSIPWKMPAYSLTAREMDLRDALDTFAVAQGLSVIMSPSVKGVFSGDFANVAPAEFLDKLSTVHNLIWYYDGAALYVYGAGETTSLLLDLRYMKAQEVRKLLADLGVEDARFPLKTASDDELIMVSGPPRYVALVAEMIEKADALREKRTFNEVETRIFKLEHIWADDVSFSASSPESSGSIKGMATLLSEIVGGMDATTHDAVATNITGGVFQPIIKPENRLNAVVVTDVSTRMPLYERLIAEMDVPQKLVELSVTSVEMSRNNALDWQLSLAAERSKSHWKGGVGQNAGNLFGEDGIEGSGLAGALTYIGSQLTVSASLTALRSKGKARNIARTSLLTVNNLAVEFSDQQTYHTKVIGTEVAQLESISAGTTLQVKPRIMNDPISNLASRVWLSLALNDGGFEGLAVETVPMTRSTSLNTQAAVYEDETIMLAGYMHDIDEVAGWGIPYLRDLPLIGWLFGGHSTTKETVQRLFLITPHIIDIDKDALARLQATRLRDITAEERLQDDADISDEEREIRDIERKDAAERRRAATDEELKRREAELDHRREMRKIESARTRDGLAEQIQAWRDQEAEEWEKLRAERDALDEIAAKAETKASEKTEAKAPAKEESKAPPKAEEKAPAKEEPKAPAKTEEKAPAKEEPKAPAKTEEKAPPKEEVKAK